MKIFSVTPSTARKINFASGSEVRTLLLASTPRMIKFNDMKPSKLYSLAGYKVLEAVDTALWLVIKYQNPLGEREREHQV